VLITMRAARLRGAAQRALLLARFVSSHEQQSP
jgi:hypothetical protein